MRKVYDFSKGVRGKYSKKVMNDNEKVEKVVDKLDGKTVLYDPPSGWMYGFPKPYKPLLGEKLEDTLIRDGYPEKDAKFGSEHCRFIGDLPQKLRELIDE